jgi:hypothetical protein
MKPGKKEGICFKLLLLCAVLLFHITVYGQTRSVVISQAKQLMLFMDTVRKNMPVEKLYLHLDKYNYLAGDTLWFKAYLLEGAYLMPSAKSGIFYAELVNSDNQVLKRFKFPVKYGLSWGNISLDENLPGGNYLLRAYTNWMRNFEEEGVYTANLYINNPAAPLTPLAFGSPVKAVPVPIVQSMGAALIVKNEQGKSSLEVMVKAGAGNKGEYYLVGQSRGVICYAVPVNLANGDLVKVIEKTIFPTGITRFTLLDINLQAINERLVYIDHHDQLIFHISTQNTIHKGRDSIALHIQVTDQNNLPVQGSFSMSITDDLQVGPGNLKSGDIYTYMLLASELKNAKNAGYYTQGTVTAQTALDSLVFTKGWLGYKWNDVVNAKAPKYKAEPEFLITGRVKSTFSGAAEGKVSLFVQKPLTFMDTIAGPDGRFVFKNIPISDTAVYKIQAANKKGKNFFINLEVDEWEPPVFKPVLIAAATENQVKDSVFIQKVKKAVALKQEQNKLSGKLLNEVNIAAKKIVRGSYNLNGPGGADQVLTEGELKKEGKKTLYNLLFERVAGLGTGGYLFPPSSKRKFGLKIKGQLVKVIIDGVDVDQSYEYWQMMGASDDESEGMQERYLHLKTNLEQFTAEDIKGVEVMYNSSYNTLYNRRFLSQAESMFSKGGLTGVGGVSGIDYAYIEITTRNGRGPFMKQTPGTYLYKPIAFSLPKKFYSPKYPNKDSSGPDIRSTIHWEPNIVTDEKGEAIVSFYAADLPATYTITIEGSDMNGRMGAITKPAYLKIVP